MKFTDLINEDDTSEKVRLKKKAKLIYGIIRKGRLESKKFPELNGDFVLTYELPEDCTIYTKKSEDGLEPHIQWTCGDLKMEVTGRHQYTDYQLKSLIMYHVGHKARIYDIQIHCIHKD